MEKEYHVVQKNEVLSLPKVLEQQNEVSSKKQDSKSTRHERETFQQQQKKGENGHNSSSFSQIFIP